MGAVTPRDLIRRVADNGSPRERLDAAIALVRDDRASAWQLAVTAWLMVASIALAVASSGCAHVAPGSPRAEASQTAAAVMIEALCVRGDPFAGSPLVVSGGHGSGVIVGPRHVLTADHVVGCSGMTSVHVITAAGRRVRAAVDLRDRDRDVARLLLDEPVLGIARPRVTEPRVGDAACSVSAYPTRGRWCGVVDGVSPVLVQMTARVRAGNSGGGVYVGSALVGIVVTRRFCDVDELVAGDGTCGGAAALVPEGWVP